jgi:hypothetical protein
MALWIPLGLFLLASSVWGWRLAFRTIYKDFGQGEWADVALAAVMACALFWTWPVFLIGSGLRVVVSRCHLDPDLFARRLAGRSREEKVRDRERAVRDREERLRRMERELGLTPLPDRERRG